MWQRNKIIAHYVPKKCKSAKFSNFERYASNTAYHADSFKCNLAKEAIELVKKFMGTCRGRSNFELPLFPWAIPRGKVATSIPLIACHLLSGISDQKLCHIIIKILAKLEEKVDRGMLCICGILLGGFYLGEFNYRYEWFVFLPCPAKDMSGLVVWQRSMLVCRWFGKCIFLISNMTLLGIYVKFRGGTYCKG